jgi:heat shock protein HtpX
MIALAFNFAMYFWSDKLVLAMYKAKLASKHTHAKLYHMVEDLSRKAQIPTPNVYIIPSNASNAFATGRNPQHGVVAFTSGILSRLSDDELEGVIAHELAHIKNRDILIATLAACFAGVISYAATFLQWMPLFASDRDGPNPLVAIVLAILAPILALVLQMAISRSREYIADETAARLTQKPAALAAALKTLSEDAKDTPMRVGSEATSALCIVSPFSGRSLFELFSTHPPMSKRIARLTALRV